MIKLYTSSSCSSCRKAIRWLKKHRIEFETINLSTTAIERKDLIEILTASENGLEDIISTQCHAYQTLKPKFEELHVEQVIKMIEEDNSFLRRPIIFDEHHFQVGYNEEGIRQFIPSQMRKVQLKKEED
ncbi:MAG: Spx/MgsR family RNA polymerase-binding regulatory protein [Streptococcaceae bacterium]|jgi:regulatory protein spx|nr:Spx/MgsR family RNA polymerase-binding regulatory protein [Streptococcaceae bacterium]